MTKKGVEALAAYSQFPGPFINANSVMTTTNKNSSNVITSTSDTILEYDALGHPTAIATGVYKRSFDYMIK